MTGTIVLRARLLKHIAKQTEPAITKIRNADPVTFSTQPNENKGQKHRAGKGIVLAIAGIGMLAFFIYMAMIVITTTQS